MPSPPSNPGARPERAWQAQAATAAGILALLALTAVWMNAPPGDAWVYALDDAYIHLALARSLVQHGVWGIDGVHQAAASSSPAWTGILALTGSVVGFSDALPFAINGILAFALGAWLTAGLPGPAWRRTLGTWFILFASAAGALIAGGMEHLLQVALVIGLLAHVEAESPRPARVAVLAALLLLTRLEGLGPVVAGIGALAWDGRRRDAAAGLAGAAAGLGLTAGINLSTGISWLPNTVLVKAQIHGAEGATLLEGFLGRHNPLALLAVGGALLAGPFLVRSVGGRARLSGAVWILAAAVHLAVGATGWFFRYEAYLLAMFAWWHARHLDALLASDWTLRAALLWVPGTVARAGVALSVTPAMPAGIYDGPIQWAEVARALGTPCGAVDVGAIAFYGEVPVVDLLGLANNEAARASLDGQRDPAFLEDLARREGLGWVCLAPPWIPDVPPSWDKVEDRVIPDATIGAGHTAFFALAVPREDLQRELRARPPAPPVQVISHP